jgi:S-adenosyl-L-methionine hydrolase (adenosine-forming)
VTVGAIYFASDYGTDDEFVGVVHAVLHRLAPGVPVIDLGPHIAPFDVTAGAGLLVRGAPFLGSGVVLGVVDP